MALVLVLESKGGSCLESDEKIVGVQVDLSELVEVAAGRCGNFSGGGNCGSGRNCGSGGDCRGNGSV